jgi:hypothetical protein
MIAMYVPEMTWLDEVSADRQGLRIMKSARTRHPRHRVQVAAIPPEEFKDLSLDLARCGAVEHLRTRKVCRSVQEEG